VPAPVRLRLPRRPLLAPAQAFLVRGLLSPAMPRSATGPSAKPSYQEARLPQSGYAGSSPVSTYIFSIAYELSTYAIASKRFLPREDRPGGVMREWAFPKISNRRGFIKESGFRLDGRLRLVEVPEWGALSLFVPVAE